jgi:hypothetical protein
MIITKEKVEIQISPKMKIKGLRAVNYQDFDTLHTDDKNYNGMLLSNKAKSFKKKSNTFEKSEEDLIKLKGLKKLHKKDSFRNKIIRYE